MIQKKIFMVGMPGSGKTTYLISLLNMLIDASISTALFKKIDVMPEEFADFEDSIKQFLLCKNLARTLVNEKRSMVLNLCDKRGNDYMLNIPDLSGEIFRDLVRERRIAKEIVSNLKEAECVLFFVNYKNMSKEDRIPIEVNNTKTNGSVYLGENNQLTTEQQRKQLQINKYREANQSEIVELLQALLELLDNRVPKIKIVLSAWDMVEKEYGDNILPKEFVKNIFPLLYQFVEMNAKKMDAEYWGVSAQGGDFANDEDLKKIQSEELNAIKVISNERKCSHDLTVLLCKAGELE